MEIGQINLTSKDIFDSPYYYLRSGDIVYIEPNAKKKKVATRDPNVLNYISISISVAHLITSIASRNINIIRRQ